jgi:anti-sigma factor RsiW
MRNLSRRSPDDRYEWLSAYLDNELAPAERQVVEQWLATDPQCQADYRRLLQMQQGFEFLRSQALPPVAQSPQSVHSSQASPWIPQRKNPWATPWRDDGRESWTRNGAKRWTQPWRLTAWGVGAMGCLLMGSVVMHWLTHGHPLLEEGVANVPKENVPSPQNTAQASINRASNSASPLQAVFVSTDAHRGGGSSLNIALDQPILAVPGDSTIP